MTKIESLKKSFEAITGELERLATFRDTPALKKFRRQLQGELSFIKQQIQSLQKTDEQKELEKQRQLELANKNRRSKNKRVWNYVKSIRENYAQELTIPEVRTQLKKHRKGLETDIPDVAWRNPSP